MTLIRGLPRYGDMFADPRGGGRALRAAWHPDHDLLVLSIWRNGRCVATSRLERDGVAELIGELATALAAAPPAAWTAPTLARTRRTVLSRFSRQMVGLRTRKRLCAAEI
jgi:hypothetical protein